MNIQEERLVQLINGVCDLSFGTLWWVRNKLWEKVITQFVSKGKNGRHPGLCLGKDKITSLQVTIPMLLGSHSNHSGFYVGGLTKNRKDDKNSFFQIKPCPLSAQYLLGKDPDITVNQIKSKLEPDENKNLREYLKAKGLSY